MKSIIAGLLVFLPLFTTAIPKQALADEIIIVHQDHHHRWIPGHWDHIFDHHRWYNVWIPGHWRG
ncbi:MAG: hypothetical protein ACYT04_51385 [Nostoc sp.]